MSLNAYNLKRVEDNSFASGDIVERKDGKPFYSTYTKAIYQRANGMGRHATIQLILLNESGEEMGFHEIPYSDSKDLKITGPKDTREARKARAAQRAAENAKEAAYKKRNNNMRNSFSKTFKEGSLAIYVQRTTPGMMGYPETLTTPIRHSVTIISITPASLRATIRHADGRTETVSFNDLELPNASSSAASFGGRRRNVRRTHKRRSLRRHTMRR